MACRHVGHRALRRPEIRAAPKADGEALPEVAAFHKYSEIENIGNFPGVFQDGEEVTMEEKIHGTNARLGLIWHPNIEKGQEEWIIMCGSHGARRKEFDTKGNRSRYWLPFSEPVKDLLTKVCDSKYNVVLFGEIYGPGVQDLHYGENRAGFRAFDLAVNGKYVDYDEKVRVCQNFGVETTPLLYRGPFSLDKVYEFTDGPTTLCAPEKCGKFKGREGVVIRPVKERHSELLPDFGRVILKSVSVDYLERRGGTEDH